jgi:hypothetical protein
MSVIRRYCDDVCPTYRHAKQMFSATSRVLPTSRREYGLRLPAVTVVIAVDATVLSPTTDAALWTGE